MEARDPVDAARGPLQGTEGVVIRNGSEGEEPGIAIRFRWSDEDRRRQFEAIVEGMMTASFGAVVARQILDRGDGGGH